MVERRLFATCFLGQSPDLVTAALRGYQNDDGGFGQALDGHLGKLLASQQADGGWPVTWEPPSEAAVLEWRGVVTVQALRTLTAYGRLAATAYGRLAATAYGRLAATA